MGGPESLLYKQISANLTIEVAVCILRALLWPSQE